MGEITHTTARALPKETQVGVSSFSLPAGFKGASEIVIEQDVKEQEICLATDSIDAVDRRVLIAYHAYGAHSLGRIASFVGVDRKIVEGILKKPSVQAMITSGQIPCWNGAELVARLSVEAETAQRPQDRISALKLLMEYRSMSQPEGGSRGFKRIAAKFMTGGNP